MSDESPGLKRSVFIWLYLAGLAIAAAAAVMEKTPGYMDADYYYAGARLIASGQGASEPYLWNYLNDPQALPAPSFAYWMPLVSLAASVGLRLFPAGGFWAARLPLILIAASVPPLAAFLALGLGEKPSAARLAGLLALFPGFYLAYMSTSDAFALEMALGALFCLLVLAARRHSSPAPQGGCFLGLGLVTGLLHLARADGALWLAAALGAACLVWRREGRGKSARLLAAAAAALAGYLLVMSPWLARNLREWGSFFPPGGSRAMWVSEYEQTMIYPASLLTPVSWLGAGWGTHLRARLDAAGVVLQTAVAVQGEIVLFPFLLAGLWKRRENLAVQLGVGMWALMALVMTLVFPFAAVNGSYFHSAAALQPLLWAVAPAGLESLVVKYAHWRRAPQASRLVRFMAGVALVTGALLSGAMYFQRVIGSQPGKVMWNASGEHYLAVEAELRRLGAAPGEAVLVNNPPGYWLASQRPALVIPYGGGEMLLAAAQRYNARYLVLERTNPWQLGGLYHGEVVPEALEYLGNVGTTRLYRIHLEQ